MSQVKKYIHQNTKKVGHPPGSLTHVGNIIQESSIDCHIYNQNGMILSNQDIMIETLLEKYLIQPFQNKTWIEFTGLQNIVAIEKIGQKLGLHPLVLEDILNTNQRPKAEIFDKYTFIVLRTLQLHEQNNEIISHQFSIILMENLVITFQEKKETIFDNLKHRLKEGNRQLNILESDYLAYAIVDIILDHYFFITEKIADKLEELDDNIILKNDSITMIEIQQHKRELNYLRKSIWPIREMINVLLRSESIQLRSITQPYWRDIGDHILELLDIVDTCRELLTSIMDNYKSNQNKQMNEIMKLLTIISTLFIPITFIAGLYGMNFKFMPELSLHWGYFIILGIMIMIEAGMMIYFRKKKWL